jgi:hypothetical protein
VATDALIVGPPPLVAPVSEEPETAIETVDCGKTVDWEPADIE